MTLSLDEINNAPHAEALQMLDGLYERSPWIVDKALSARPFKSLPHLKAALTQVVNAATKTEQLGLLQIGRAHV